MSSVKDLKTELKKLGATGYSKLKKADLLVLLEKTEKINKKNLTRIQYTKAGKKSDTAKNLKRKNDTNKEIFDKPSTSFSKQEIKDKLIGYSIKDVDDLKSGSKKWVRYMVYKDGKYLFRVGGFIISNTKSDNFVAFANISQRFSFSVPKVSGGKKTIFFESSKRGQNFSKQTKAFLEKYFDNEDKEFKRSMLWTVILPDFTEVFHLKNKKEVLDLIGSGSDVGLSKAMRLKNNIFKKHWITRGLKSEIEQISTDFDTLRASGDVFKDINDDVEEVVDRLL